MTRERAVKAANLLNEIETFESFIGEVMELYSTYSQECNMKDFYAPLSTLFIEELKKRENALLEL